MAKTGDPEWIYISLVKVGIVLAIDISVKSQERK